MSDVPYTTIAQLARQLDDGSISSVELVESCLARIADKSGEGERVFVNVEPESVRAQAARFDAGRARGGRLGKGAGIPISVKDAFDVEGQVTTAGSTFLQSASPATSDAAAVSRLRSAGFIVIGRTNMTEFAYSGLGLNPHHGTPKSPWDRATGRIPGGSSSGAAISVTDGMALGAIGTDTGGSCRIPAAFSGITGFKPTASRIPRSGVMPLSTSLDSVGPLGNSVSCCATLFSVMALAPVVLAPPDLRSVRLLVPRQYLVDDMDKSVSDAFAEILQRLSRAGATLVDDALPALANLPAYNLKGGFTAAEGYFVHRDWLAKYGDAYDPRVRSRLLRGMQQSAADYLDLVENRKVFIREMERDLAYYDAVLFPTVPVIAPEIALLEQDDELYSSTNLLVLRNSTVVNFLDGCAVSLPIHRPGEAPVGLTIAGPGNRDEAILNLAAAIEAVIGCERSG